MSDLRSISQIRSEASANPLSARVRGQVDELVKKESANGKPYWELKLRDSGDVLTLRAWSDTDAFRACAEIARGDFVEVEGDFAVNGGFGLDARRWRLRTLDEEEVETLLAGGAEEAAAVDRDFGDVVRLVGEIRDPRLRAL